MSPDDTGCHWLSLVDTTNAVPSLPAGVGEEIAFCKHPYPPRIAFDSLFHRSAKTCLSQAISSYLKRGLTKIMTAIRDNPNQPEPIWTNPRHPAL